jgi:hypothetical protein
LSACDGDEICGGCFGRVYLVILFDSRYRREWGTEMGSMEVRLDELGRLRGVNRADVYGLFYSRGG